MPAINCNFGIGMLLCYIKSFALRIPLILRLENLNNNLKQIVKALNTILIIFFFTNTYGQEIPQKDGCIEIKIVMHYFRFDKNGEITKRTSNKLNRPNVLLYFDSSGNLIEKVGYGKQHNTDLRILNFVEQNKFENGKLIEVEEKYISNDVISRKTVLHYNKVGLIIRIDYYQELSNYYDYRLQEYTEIKSKFCIQPTPEIIEKINQLIYNE